MTLPVHFVVALQYVAGLHNASVSLSRNIASLRNRSNIPIHVRFASNVTLKKCTGKVVRLNIQFEITNSTTIVEYNTTMALVNLMERCNFISAGTETEATGHFIL